MVKNILRMDDENECERMMETRIYTKCVRGSHTMVLRRLFSQAISQDDDNIDKKKKKNDNDQDHIDITLKYKITRVTKET